MLIIIIIISVIIALWMGYEINRAPLVNGKDEIIEDPTTDSWDDNDMHHTDAKF